MTNAQIAQLVEHSTDTRAVPSSNLGLRTENGDKKCKLKRLLIF